MALVALLDGGMRLAGYLLGDHVEMHHVVTGRGLVALGAVQRGRGWMTKLRERPGGCGVAGCAVVAEQLEVAVVVLMAHGTIENHLMGGKVRVGKRDIP